MASKKETGQFHKYRFLPICICLVLATLAVYWPVYKYDFVSYDDDDYITSNINIQSGLNRQSICWAFTAAGSAYFWHPLTWLSHILDWQLFGPNAGGHHLVNLIFHIANTLLLFIILKRMTGALWPSAFAAALFALHPLHVESVAWVYERKDVLSTFFWFLTMWAYVRFVEHPKITNYLLIVVFLALGLMSKPMLVTLPFVLLLLDYWPLQRFDAKRSLSLLIEKIPLFAMVFASCIAAFVNQKKIGAMSSTENLSFLSRLANASISYMQYIIKMIWPVRLAVFYPHPLKNVSIFYAVMSAIVLLTVTILVLRFAGRHRYLVTGWFWYLGTLLPVIGLVQIGIQAMADHYSYITLTGLFIIIAWSAKEFVPPQRYKTLVLPAGAVLIILAAAAHSQLRYWKNSITLFEHTLAVTKDNEHIRKNYADCLMDAGRLDEAIEQLDKLLKTKPDSAEFRCNLGCALAGAGKNQEAMEQFKLAIEYEPNYALSYFNLAVVLQKQGELEDAVFYYKQAVKIEPDYINAYLNLSAALIELGRSDAAIEACNKVLELEPDNTTARKILEAAMKKQKTP